MTWDADWARSLPLILINVVTHVLGLLLIYTMVVRAMRKASRRRHFGLSFVVDFTCAVLLIIVLHGLQAATWAAMYKLLGALPGVRSAMLYSLGAITSYGHASLFLTERWQLLGALEALNGVLLFGLTTAFLFAMIQDVGAMQDKKRKNR